jgi:large subunit ribosomal protein L13
MIIINAENKILGRLSSEVAEKLLKSKDKIVVVNSEKIIISGKKKQIVNMYLERKEKGGKGNPKKNPKFHRYPDKIFLKTVRNMLPRKPRGVEALKKLKVYIDVPEEYKNNLTEATPLQNIEHISLYELSRKLGANLK